MLLTLLATVAAVLVWARIEVRDAAYVTGWALAALMVFLTLYNLRKKMP